MIRSMTGFGEAVGETDGVHYSVEVRSLNNRFFKGTVRLPEDIQGLEPEIDSILRNRLTRGSITVTVRYSNPTASAAYGINMEALRTYRDRLVALNGPDDETTEVDLTALLSLPGVLQPPTDFEHRVDRARPVLHQLVGEACDGLMEMRRREGEALHADLHKHREDIEVRLERIAERAPTVVEEYHQRLRQRIERMLSDADVAVEDADLVREVAVYAERSDISEEITRLSAHLAQFRDLIDRESCEAIGRTLDFLAQEMLREANTIASKCNDAPISREIVEVKGAIDRIKEQVQNVE